MLVVDLHCELGHLFEGWFASGDELQAQQARGLLSCPVCGSHEVVRRPSAARLNVSSLKADKLAPAQPHTSAEPMEPEQALQALYLQAVRHVIAHTEDVGESFAEEVRSIHQGEAPQRAIRGQASTEEREALREEGIEVLSLPIPASLKGPLQ